MASRERGIVSPAPFSRRDRRVRIPGVPRLFVATDLPESLCRSLAALARTVPGGRPVRAEQVHLTLHFAGELGDAAAGRLRAALGSVDSPAFQLRVRGVGCFPKRRDPRVVWAGLEESEALAALHASVDQALRAAGFETESRPFHPHLTLARLRRPDPRAIRAWLEDHADLAEAPVEVAELRLYSSRLEPSGAVHRVEARWPLARG